jgi:hypothetical protein
MQGGAKALFIQKPSPPSLLDHRTTNSGTIAVELGFQAYRSSRQYQAVLAGPRAATSDPQWAVIQTVLVAHGSAEAGTLLEDDMHSKEGARSAGRCMIEEVHTPYGLVTLHTMLRQPPQRFHGLHLLATESTGLQLDGIPVALR